MNPIPNSYWVASERLLAGEYPGGWNEEQALEKLDSLLDAGIQSFVDLTEAHEQNAYERLLRGTAAARQIDVRYRRMSVEDLGTPTVEHMSLVLQHIATEIEEGRAVYVHCWGGIGRTGTVVGCWMVQNERRTAEEALQRIVELRRGTPEESRRSPETPQQRDFVLRWCATSDRDETA
jgi:protein-tyrosine phosphatase